ncbi:magnesium and cobalt transport protein CorA [Lacrimispora amygdalina]|uniref:magnesium and cobalt transport protein CorA n=1 Tax=Lacrimispora amygdalina TaxID=253257 RepID=UPI000BE2FA35|nr:magnesium and cobalt transport protein CorA [Lacrimispora amygdalina]
MTKKQQLYYLLEAFNRREYDVATFCKTFEEVFYPDIPSDELTADELAQFEALAEIVVRFSPFDEDIKAYPKVYRTKVEVESAIKAAFTKLIKS